MQKLFNMEPGSHQGVFSIPWWTYIEDGLKRNLEQVVTHYRRFPIAVPSSHFLIKVLTTVGIYRNTEFEQFCETVFDKAVRNASALGLTSSLSRGTLFDGVFYGDGVKEIIIGHDEEFDIYEARKNWRDLQPIKVLSHPKSDLGLMVPNGESYSGEEGIAVIAINLPMLALQYRQFRLLEDKIAEETGDSPRSIMQFIHGYALTNMLYSHLDWAVFNRLYNTLSNIPYGYCNRKHPFQLIDYRQRLNQVQALQVELLHASNRKFDGVMKTIPLVTCEDLRELVQLPECALTRQILWALAVSRIPVLSFLFKSSGNNPRKLNGSDVNHIVRAFELWNTDKALKASLPVHLYFDYKTMMNDVLRV